MFKKLMAIVLCLSLLNFTGFYNTSQAAQAAPADNDEPVRSVDFTQVKITDDYWGSYQKMFICQVIPTGISNVEAAGGGIPNIMNAARKNRGEEYGAFNGAFYVDSDVHKVLESMCYALEIDPMGDEEIIQGQQYIKDKLEEWIPYFVDAQEKEGEFEGYFDTYFTLGANGNTPRWWDFNLHELYVAGHFYEAAIAHYRATGGQDDRLLNVAIKNADYIDSLFGEGKWKQVPGHQEIELALIKLANLCEEIGGDLSENAERYVALSKFFLDTRGDYEGRHGTNHNNQYDQDHLPVQEQMLALGHSVRAAYMYTAMADVALKVNTDEYNKALLALWEDVEYTKTYINGGVGASRGHEGYGAQYELPNDTAYCETCANISHAMWNQRMNLLFGDSKYFDVVERNLYNSIISCVNFDGDKFFYDNPMSSTGGSHRSQWFGTACCPPNLMRTVEALGGYVYTQQGDIITQNLYIGNETSLLVDDKEITLNTETNLPWEGQSSVTVNTNEPQEFTLRLRIPEWTADSYSLRVNGEEPQIGINEKGYVEITRVWDDSDEIRLDFNMQTRRVYSDERVVTNLGYTAVKRGPIVYAAENADNDYNVKQIFLPKELGDQFTTEWVENLDGKADPYGIKGVVKVSIPAKAATLSGEEDTTLTMIPYYAWDNREAGQMVVFVNEERPEFPLEYFAVPWASHTYRGDSIYNLNDGSDARWTNWDSNSSLYLNPQVSYTFENEVTLWGCDVKWYQDSGGVRVPDGLEIVYQDENGEMVPVTPLHDYNTFTPNRIDTYEFEPINTKVIQLNIRTDEKKYAAGIMEWMLRGSMEAVDFDNITISEVLYGHRTYEVEYHQFNAVKFSPVTTDRIRIYTTANKPIGLRELRVMTKDGNYVEQQATPSASYTCEEYSQLEGVNNGLWDNSSYYNGVTDVWSTYRIGGGYDVHEWLEYSFEEPMTFVQMEAFWYRAHDDGVIAPLDWVVQYWDEESNTWLAVNNVVLKLEEFDNDVNEYDVIIEGDEIPYTTVKSDSPFAVIDVQQAGGVPGQAVISIQSKYNSDIIREYRINYKFAAEGTDKTKLKALIESAKVLDSDGYTEVSWNLMQQQLARAESVYEDGTASEREVEHAYNMLYLTMNMLQPKEGVNKVILKIFIDEAEAAKERDEYKDKDQSFRDTFDTVLGESIGVYNDEEATQEGVLIAAAALLEQIHRLGLGREGEDVDKTRLEEYYNLGLLLLDMIDRFGDADAVQEFKDAMDEAEGVLNDEVATQAEVDAAYDRLVNAVNALQPIPAGVDKTNLRFAINTGNGIKANKDMYVEKGWDAFITALDEAIRVEADSEDQDEIDAATEMLALAMTVLRKKADKSLLSASIVKAQGIDLSLYTEESASPLIALMEQAAIFMADAALSEDNQKDIDDLTADLLAAIDGLVKKGTKPGDDKDKDTGGDKDDDTNDDTNGNTNNDKDTKSGSSKGSGKNNTKNGVKTGDNNIAMVYLLLSILALSGAGVAFIIKKRNTMK